jgi:hypothetical protein
MKISLIIVLIFIAIISLKFTDDVNATKNLKSIIRKNILRDQRKAAQQRNEKRESQRSAKHEERRKIRK